MTKLMILLTVLYAGAPSNAAEHHRHEAGSLPAAAEACSCGSSRSTREECSIRNDAGDCVVEGAGKGRCDVWHCHPGADAAHKAPWTAGKTVPLAPLPDSRRPAAPGAADCRPSLPAGRFPGKVSPPSVSQLAYCQEWVSEFHVDYPIKNKTADCSAPIATLVTRCVATLDPAFRLQPKSLDGEECSCAEWTGTALEAGPGLLHKTVAKQVCTAQLCRPKRPKG